MLSVLRQRETRPLCQLQRPPWGSGRRVAVCPSAPPPRAICLLQPLRPMASWRVVPSECSEWGVSLLIFPNFSKYLIYVFKIRFKYVPAPWGLGHICLAIIRESNCYNSCNDNIIGPTGLSGIIVQPFHRVIIQSQVSPRMKSWLHYDLSLTCVSTRETVESWETVEMNERYL